MQQKGWQKKSDKGVKEQDLRSTYHKYLAAWLFWHHWVLCADNHFLIFAQPDLPLCDCFYWLPMWVAFLQNYHYGQLLEPEDYVFPAMGANGVVQPREHISHDTVQKLISKAISGTGISSTAGGSFSTHCFCRAGAHYHFMFAPISKHWTLQRVHWWGGWAEGEHISPPKSISLYHTILDAIWTARYSHMLPPWWAPPIWSRSQWCTVPNSVRSRCFISQWACARQAGLDWGSLVDTSILVIWHPKCPLPHWI